MSNDFLLSGSYAFHLQMREKGKVFQMNITHTAHGCKMMMSYGSLQKSINYRQGEAAFIELRRNYENIHSFIEWKSLFIKLKLLVNIIMR